MKFLYLFVLIATCILGFANACGGRICAIDKRSGNLQNFLTLCAMREENDRGGS